jgi:hypothetical protein
MYTEEFITGIYSSDQITFFENVSNDENKLMASVRFDVITEQKTLVTACF